MLICVFGYYGKGNAGDDRLQSCLVRLFADQHTVVFVPHMLPPPKDLLRQCDLVIIGGGGLVFERVGIWVNIREWLEATGVPVMVVGLGINRIDDRLAGEVKDLLDRCQLAMVRDSVSAELGGNHPSLAVGTDISWFYPYPEKAYDAEARKGVAINLVPCHWREYDPKAWINALDGESLLPFPFLTTGHNTDHTLLASLLPRLSMPEEFSLSPLENCELAVVCRYHAVHFALQLGVPFIAISYDYKVERLVKDANLSDYLLDTHQHAALPERLRHLRANRAQALADIKKYATAHRALGQAWRSKILEKVAETKRAPVRSSLSFRIRNKLASLL